MPPYNYFHIRIDDGREGGQSRNIFMVPQGGSVQLLGGLRVTLAPRTLNMNPKPNGVPDILVQDFHTGGWQEFQVPSAQVQHRQQIVGVEQELPYMYDAMPQAFRAPNAVAQHPSHGSMPFVPVQDQIANANANTPSFLQDENGSFGMPPPQYNHGDGFPHQSQDAANFPSAVDSMSAPAYQDVNNPYGHLPDDVSGEEDEDAMYMSFQQPTSFQHGVPAQGHEFALPRPFAPGHGVRRVPIVPPPAYGDVNSDIELASAPSTTSNRNGKRRQPDAPILPSKRRYMPNLAPSTTPASFPSVHAPNPPTAHTSSGPAATSATGPGPVTATGPGPITATGSGTGTATGPGTGTATRSGPATATGPATTPGTGPGTGPANATATSGTGPANATAAATATASATANARIPGRVYGNKVLKKGQPKPTGPQPADLFPPGSAAAGAVAAWERRKAENRAKRELAERERVERERAERERAERERAERERAERERAERDGN